MANVTAKTKCKACGVPTLVIGDAIRDGVCLACRMGKNRQENRYYQKRDELAEIQRRKWHGRVAQGRGAAVGAGSIKPPKPQVLGGSSEDHLS